MYHKADKPGRVYTGAVAYVKRSNTSLQEACDDRMLTQYNDRIKRFVYNHTEAKGPCVARWQGAQAYRGERYYMQIDSHMDFTPGWDTRLIEMLHKAPSPKAVLTAYPSARGTEKSTLIPVNCKAKFQYQGMPEWSAILLARSAKYHPTPLVAGGFYFTYGTAIQEVPFDPNLPYLFVGEESMHSARLWTNGWDFYAPTDNLVYHHYGRHHMPKFWDDLRGAAYNKGLEASLRIVRAMLNGTAENATFAATYPYGLGTLRKLDDFWSWSRVDWKKRNSTSSDKFCK